MKIGNGTRMITAMLVMILSVALIVGCGKKDDDNDITGPGTPTINSNLLGTWESTQLSVFNGALVLTPEDSMFIFITVNLKADGTLDFTTTEGDSITEGTGTWSATATQATISLSSDLNIAGTYTLDESKTVLTVNATVNFDMTPDGVDNPIQLPVTVTFTKKED